MEVVIPGQNFGIRIDMSQCLLDIKSSMESILHKWTTLPTIGGGEVDGISFCMLQMMTCKLSSFFKITNGNGRQDIETLSAIARGVYEMAFIYHNMFVTPENEKETEILLLLWKIRGFNNRLYSNNPYQSPEQRIRDEEEVNRFRQKVEAIIKELSISEDATKQIQHALGKGTSKVTGYQFVKDNDGKITSFMPISFEKTSGLFKNKEKQVLYEMLSSHSHPSYLGVKHFDYMHNVNNAEIERVKEYVLQSACFCSAKFVMDVCQRVKCGSELRECIPSQIRFYMNIFHGM